MMDDIYDSGWRRLASGAARWTRRRLIQAFGLALALAAPAAFLAWVGFVPEDPSWNTAGFGEVRNRLGAPGAVAADLLHQTFGYCAPLLVIPPGLWGVRLAVSSGDDAPLRREIVAWPTAVILAAGSFAAAPTLQGWPLSAGRGGLLGDGVVAVVGGLWDLVAAATAAPHWTGDAALVAAAVGAVVLFGVAVRGWGPLAGGCLRLSDLIFDAVQGRGRSTSAQSAFDAEEPDEAVIADRAPPAEPARRRKRQAKAASPASPSTSDTPPRPRPDKPAVAVDRSSKRATRQTALSLMDGDYDQPPLDLLSKPPARVGAEADDESLQENARLLETVLSDFGVKGDVRAVRPGPVVTLYEFEPAAGTKSSRVIGLADDVARNMSAVACRIAVVPGRTTLGVELPNRARETVALREMFEAGDFQSAKAKLPLALGKDIGGAPVIADLAAMPHLLVAGTTGSGKSVAVNAMILSLVQRLSPDECRLVMIDPKMLELSVYNGMPHLLSPVVTDPKKAVAALRWTVREMESRYQAMSKVGVRNIIGFNERVAEALAAGETLSRRVQTGYDKETGQPVYEDEEIRTEKMPYLVVFIDEMADLMLVAGKDIEAAVQRLAQMARAAGIHLVMATQRPSVDVITGTIKANFPTRISFQVTSKIDSRTILGEQGAEQLLGKGDMLFMAGGGRVKRVHGPFVSDEEVEKIVAHLKEAGPPDYVEAVTEAEEDAVGGPLEPFGEGDDGENSLYDQAVAVVARDKRASTSYVQRRLKIGYNRAASLIERMEQEGVVSAPNHAGKREVLVGEPGEGVRE